MSFFDEVETTVANTRFLQAVEDTGPIVLNTEPYESLSVFEKELKARLTMKMLLTPKTAAYYLFKRYLEEDGMLSWVAMFEAFDYFRKAHKIRHELSERIWRQHLDPETAGDDENGDVRERDRKDILMKERPVNTKEHKILARYLHKKFSPLMKHIRKGMRQDNIRKKLFTHLVKACRSALQDKMGSFIASKVWPRYVQVEHYASREVQLEDFRIFRVLGRGAFGAVSAVQKMDTHAIFAMKEMGKRQVKQNRSEWMVINEKKVLSKMKSPFVLSLKYSFHTPDSLFLIFDMCSGGDLKFHLRNAREESKLKAFEPERARFYAAEVLLGLEHLHEYNIIYRDLKPNNILLDDKGHVKISDLGLTIKLRKNKILKHLAGTAGYWAPEIVMKTGTYKVSDYWSFGVFLYEMLAGKRPKCRCDDPRKTLQWCPFGQKRVMEDNALKENGVLKLNVSYSDIDNVTADLLKKLFEPDPKQRIGFEGVEEIKSHAYFASIDWEKLANLEIDPPYVPDGRKVHANSIGEVGEFQKNKYNKVTLSQDDEKNYHDFNFKLDSWVQEELDDCLLKQDNPVPQVEREHQGSNLCCTIL